MQSGFRPGKGTREGIFSIRTIRERAIKVGKDIYICFFDHSKEFDMVKHSKIIECLKEIGLDGKDLQIITKLYWDQTAVVHRESGVSTEFEIKKGVRQGCMLSPSLFNLYKEKIFREVENMNGVKINGITINNLRYADDTALLCICPNDLQMLLNVCNKAGKPYSMQMNIKTTKIMVVSKTSPSPKINITLEGSPIQQTSSLSYLGSLITDDGRCKKEVKRRIEIARSAFVKMNKILTSRKISIDTRKRICVCYVWSTFLYGLETWT